MNTETAVASYVFAGVLVILISGAVWSIRRGWRHRASRQGELIGSLPELPTKLGAATIVSTEGLYVGSTLVYPQVLGRSSSASQWLERIAVADLGYRAKAKLSRYSEGILLELSGARPIWIPHDAICDIRTTSAFAGKVLPRIRRKNQADQAILVIRWRLPSGHDIDTGFLAKNRTDNRSAYAPWLTPHKTGDEG